MEAGTEETRTAGFEKENPSIMRRNAMLRLREELAYRTQQRIVRATAWDYGRLEDGRAVTTA
jgi:hypothetical protein